jgi:hypothetical protein
MITRTAIKDILTENGLGIAVTTQRLADFLHVTGRTITGQKNSGKLKQVRRNTFDIDAVVDWLYANPQYITKIQR